MHTEGDAPYFELPFQKNGQPQYVPLGERLTLEVFTAANVAKLKTTGRPTLRRVAGEYVFPYSYATVYGRFGRFCERTGLPNRGLHNFRHTYATSQLIRGVPLQAVSALLGHSNPGITGRTYNHVNAMHFRQYVR
jgi:integrase